MIANEISAVDLNTNHRTWASALTLRASMLCAVPTCSAHIRPTYVNTHSTTAPGQPMPSMSLRAGRQQNDLLVSPFHGIGDACQSARPCATAPLLCARHTQMHISFQLLCRHFLLSLKASKDGNVSARTGMVAESCLIKDIISDAVGEGRNADG